MRNICAAVISVALVSSGAFAADSVGALPAGKPAGVAAAQDANSSTILFVAGGIGLAGLVALGLMNNNNNSNANNNNNIIAPSTTTS